MIFEKYKIIVFALAFILISYTVTANAQISFDHVTKGVGIDDFTTSGCRSDGTYQPGTTDRSKISGVVPIVNIGNPKYPPGPDAGCGFDLGLRSILTATICAVQSIIAFAMFNVFCSITVAWAPVVVAAVTLYTIFYGIAITLGINNASLTGKDGAAMRFIKISIIIGIAVNPDYFFFWVYDFFMGAVNDFSIMIVNLDGFDAKVDGNGNPMKVYDPVTDEMVVNNGSVVPCAVQGTTPTEYRVNPSGTSTDIPEYPPAPAQPARLEFCLIPGTPSAPRGTSVFELYDVIFAQVVGGNAGDSVGEALKDQLILGVIFAAIFGFTGLGLVIGFMLMVGVFSMIVAFVWLMIAYTTAIMSLSFVLMFTPIFLSFLLFSPTKRIFNAWMGSVIAYVMQPVLILMFLFVIAEATSLDLFISRISHVAKVYTPWDLKLEGSEYVPDLERRARAWFFIPDKRRVWMRRFIGTYDVRVPRICNPEFDPAPKFNSDSKASGGPGPPGVNGHLIDENAEYMVWENAAPVDADADGFDDITGGPFPPPPLPPGDPGPQLNPECPNVTTQALGAVIKRIIAYAVAWLILNSLATGFLAKVPHLALALARFQGHRGYMIGGRSAKARGPGGVFGSGTNKFGAQRMNLFNEASTSQFVNIGSAGTEMYQQAKESAGKSRGGISRLLGIRDTIESGRQGRQGIRRSQGPSAPRGGWGGTNSPMVDGGAGGAAAGVAGAGAVGAGAAAAAGGAAAAAGGAAMPESFGNASNTVNDIAAERFSGVGDMISRDHGITIGLISSLLAMIGLGGAAAAVYKTPEMIQARLDRLREIKRPEEVVRANAQDFSDYNDGSGGHSHDDLAEHTHSDEETIVSDGIEYVKSASGSYIPKDPEIAAALSKSPKTSTWRRTLGQMAGIGAGLAVAGGVVGGVVALAAGGGIVIAAIIPLLAIAAAVAVVMAAGFIGKHAGIIMDIMSDEKNINKRIREIQALSAQKMAAEAAAAQEAVGSGNLTDSAAADASPIPVGSGSLTDSAAANASPIPVGSGSLTDSAAATNIDEESQKLAEQIVLTNNSGKETLLGGLMDDGKIDVEKKSADGEGISIAETAAANGNVTAVRSMLGAKINPVTTPTRNDMLDAAVGPETYGSVKEKDSLPVVTTLLGAGAISTAAIVAKAKGTAADDGRKYPTYSAVNRALKKHEKTTPTTTAPSPSSLKSTGAGATLGATVGAAIEKGKPSDDDLARPVIRQQPTIETRSFTDKKGNRFEIKSDRDAGTETRTTFFTSGETMELKMIADTGIITRTFNDADGRQTKQETLTLDIDSGAIKALSITEANRPNQSVNPKSKNAEKLYRQMATPFRAQNTAQSLRSSSVKLSTSVVAGMALVRARDAGTKGLDRSINEAEKEVIDNLQEVDRLKRGLIIEKQLQREAIDANRPTSWEELAEKAEAGQISKAEGIRAARELLGSQGRPPKELSDQYVTPGTKQKEDLDTLLESVPDKPLTQGGPSMRDIQKGLPESAVRGSIDSVFDWAERMEAEEKARDAEEVAAEISKIEDSRIKAQVESWAKSQVESGERLDGEDVRFRIEDQEIINKDLTKMNTGRGGWKGIDWGKPPDDDD